LFDSCFTGCGTRVRPWIVSKTRISERMSIGRLGAKMVLIHWRFFLNTEMVLDVILSKVRWVVLVNLIFYSHSEAGDARSQPWPCLSIRFVKWPLNTSLKPVLNPFVHMYTRPGTWLTNSVCTRSWSCPWPCTDQPDCSERAPIGPVREHNISLPLTRIRSIINCWNQNERSLLSNCVRNPRGHKIWSACGHFDCPLTALILILCSPSRAFSEIVDNVHNSAAYSKPSAAWQHSKRRKIVNLRASICSFWVISSFHLVDICSSSVSFNRRRFWMIVEVKNAEKLIDIVGIIFILRME
jgi:hypothetical protein